MHPVLRIFNRLLTAILILAGVMLAGLYYLKLQFDEPGPLAAAKQVVIPQGKGVGAIADELQDAGVISDRRIFVSTILYFKAFRHRVTLKAGEYEFPAQASMRQVLDTLVQGKGIEHKITIAEGLTSQQIVQKLNDDPELAGTIQAVPAEGSLLPDTYLFDKGDTRQEIIDRMRQAQADFLAKEWPLRNPGLPFDSPEQAVILASIVEKETGVPQERPMIASVFENRLEKHMRLQSDPTIIYGLVGGKGSLGRPILQSELSKQTAYNTYQIDGLPPTPIANPGRASITAVLKPAKTNDLYFVADGSGGHAFAATLVEHNKNVAKWRKLEKAREDAAAAQGASGAAGTDVPAPADGTGTDAAATGSSPDVAAKAGANGQPPLPAPNPKLHKEQ
jgi:UPF0755 protein